jgi:hypothetical protein
LGKFIFEQRKFYEGEFSNDMYHGFGIFHDNTLQEGMWQNNLFLFEQIKEDYYQNQQSLENDNLNHEHINEEPEKTEENEELTTEQMKNLLFSTLDENTLELCHSIAVPFYTLIFRGYTEIAAKHDVHTNLNKDNKISIQKSIEASLVIILSCDAYFRNYATKEIEKEKKKQNLKFVDFKNMGFALVENDKYSKYLDRIMDKDILNLANTILYNNNSFIYKIKSKDIMNWADALVSKYSNFERAKNYVYSIENQDYFNIAFAMIDNYKSENYIGRINNENLYHFAMAVCSSERDNAYYHLDKMKG